ncbi:MAG: hypothetical protein QM504_06840 [Pseudomonadota bacterium]
MSNDSISVIKDNLIIKCKDSSDLLSLLCSNNVLIEDELGDDILKSNGKVVLNRVRVK